MKIYDVVQPSPEWHLLRMVRPTASNFDRIMMPGKRCLSAQVDDYIKEIIAAQTCEYLPERAEVYLTRPMRLGVARESEACHWYSMQTGYETVKIGFVTTDDGRFGCSPDRGVMVKGELAGLLEVKCPLMKTHRKWADAGGVPREHLCQVHGALIVSGLPWVEFVSYPPPVRSEYEYTPPFRVRVEPDDFTKDLRKVLEEFWDRYIAKQKEML